MKSKEFDIIATYTDGHIKKVSVDFDTDVKKLCDLLTAIIPELDKVVVVDLETAETIIWYSDFSKKACYEYDENVSLKIHEVKF